MGYTFNIADLHGRRDLLDAAIKAIEAYTDSGTVVFTGDYIDRGPDSRGVIDRLIKGPTDKNKWRWITLKGNHETFMVDSLQPGRFADLHWWVEMNGGDKTLWSYDNTLSMGKSELIKYATTLVDAAHVKWVDSRSLYYEDDHRVFVHAGVNYSQPLDSQSEHTMIWMLYPTNADGGWYNYHTGKTKHVVHGHHQHVHGPLHVKDRHNYDTGAWYTGRLVIGVWNDEQADPIDNIEIVGPDLNEMIREGWYV
jgi:serine/threonine protein phosphatase 1